MTVTNIIESEYLPDLSTWQTERELPIRPIRRERNRFIPKQRLETPIVSAEIDLPTLDIENKTVSIEEKGSRILTPIQAYEVALKTLRVNEAKWNAYVQEEARILSVFDDEEEQ